MASKSLKVEQTEAFARDVTGMGRVRSASFEESAGEPVVLVRAAGAVYNDVQNRAYEYGLEPRGAEGQFYVFGAGRVESASAGPASRL